MRSLLRMLGLSTGVPDGASEDARDTSTVRRIAAQLERLDRSEARYLAAFAYVLARVAHSDLEVSREEELEMERLVRACAELSAAQAALVVQIAKAQTVTLGGTENYLVTRQFKELSTREQRLGLVRCLFAVSAADTSISEVENQQVSQVANEIGLTSAETAAVRGDFKDRLAVLKGMKP